MNFLRLLCVTFGVLTVSAEIDRFSDSFELKNEERDFSSAAHLIFLEAQTNSENEFHMQTNFIMQNSRARLVDTLLARKDRLDKLRLELSRMNFGIKFPMLNDELAMIATYLQALDTRIKIALAVLTLFLVLYLFLGVIVRFLAKKDWLSRRYHELSGVLCMCCGDKNKSDVTDTAATEEEDESLVSASS